MNVGGITIWNAVIDIIIIYYAQHNPVFETQALWFQISYKLFISWIVSLQLNGV